MPLLHLFHWNADEAESLAGKLEAAGYATSLHTQGGGLPVRDMQNAAAVVIHLSRLPSQGRAVAAWLRGSKSTRGVPIVFVDGLPEKIARVKRDLPDAIYTSSKNLVGALKKARSPARPVTPPQMMDGTGRTNAQKLGIREGARVLLIDPPANYVRVLGALPEGVELVDAGPCDVTLWFVHDPGEYQRGLVSHSKRAASSRLWIIWKKASAISTAIT